MGAGPPCRCTRSQSGMTGLSLGVPNVAEQLSTANVIRTGSQKFNGINLEHIYYEFKDVFEGLGSLGASLRLEVDEDVKPVQEALGRVPEAAREPLKQYLDDLKAKGVIEKVERATV